MNTYIVRRYLLFAVSLFVNALGIAFITRALLGTSPITSVTYVLSMFTPLTIGQWTILFNLSFMVFELFFMTRKDLRSDWQAYLMQVPISLCFGLFIDLSMNILFWLHPADYFLEVVSLLVGCCILAAGIALEVKASVAMVAGEYFVKSIARRLRKDFGFVKLSFDVTLVILSCVLSLVFMGGIYGVREGTVVAALIVGPIVHFISPYYRFLDGWIQPRTAVVSDARTQGGHKIITIAREYGSGGHLLGEMLARELGVKLYDREFIRMAATKLGMDEAYVLKNEQSIPSFWLKCIFAQSGKNSLDRSLSPDDVLFVAESRMVQELAAKGPCVIVGRCADCILKDNPNVIKVFCYSDSQSAIRRCTEEYNLTVENAASEIKRINRNRITHYEYYTGRKWGDPHHYDLLVNTGSMDLQMVCDLIKAMYEHWESRPTREGAEVRPQ